MFLTHCSGMDFSTLIYWKSPFATEGVLGVIFLYLFGSREKLLLLNSGDPDQTPHYVAFDQGLHCLPMHTLRCLGFPTTIG